MSSFSNKSWNKRGTPGARLVSRQFTHQIRRCYSCAVDIVSKHNDLIGRKAVRKFCSDCTKKLSSEEKKEIVKKVMHNRREMFAAKKLKNRPDNARFIKNSPFRTEA